MLDPPGGQPSFSSREWAIALGLFAAAFVALAWPWLSGAVTIPWDAKSQFYPQQVFLARTLAQGQAPWWTENVFAGWPQIADPQSLIFSPPHFLLALVNSAPGFQAVDGVSFATLFLGGAGTMLLFHDRGWHPAGAVVAALAFAAGSSCASRLQHTGQIMSIAYLPLALWLTARTTERGSWLAGAAAGLVAGLIVLGRDQVALLALYLLGAFTLTSLFIGESFRSRLRMSVGPLALAAVVGLCVIIIPLVMTALLALDSNRPAIDYVSAGRGSLHPAHLLTLVFADLYGANDPNVPYWGPASFPWGPTGLFLAQNMGQLYAGALVVVAIVGIGIVRGVLWDREIRFFTIAAIVVMLYALGWYTRVFRVLYELLPGISLFRRPADATFVLGVLLAILAGYCIHRLLTGLRPLRQAHCLIAAGIAVSLVAAAVALALNVGTLQEATLPILGTIGWVLAASIAAAMAAFARAQPLFAAAILVVFATADLAWNNGPNESTGLPPATYDALRPDTRNETVALLKTQLAATAAPDRRDRIELTGIGYHWPNLSLVHGFENLFGQNPLRLRDFAQATGVGDTVAVPDQRGFAPLFPSYRSALADLFGLRFIATGVPVGQIDPKLKAGYLRFIARTADAYVYENPRALPRAMLMTDWRQADFSALLRDGWPTDVDPSRTVLLDRALPAPSPATAAPTGSARITSYTTTEISIEVDAPDGGILLLNDVWHPWWVAQVDGALTEILKANALFRAVALAPGRHTVRFSFRPFAGALAQLKQKLGW